MKLMKERTEDKGSVGSSDEVTEKTDSLLDKFRSSKGALRRSSSPGSLHSVQKSLDAAQAKKLLAEV